MKNTGESFPSYKIQENFDELIFKETAGEIFSGRRNYEDLVHKFFSPEPLHQRIDEEFDRVYEFEKAVLDFFEFFKKDQIQEKKIQ